VKLEWYREEYTVYCTNNERSILPWFKTAIWKLRGTRKGFDKGRSPLYRNEDAVHVDLLLNCSEARKWREPLFFNSKMA
jgi:hypothetical protein